jgi:hypothetical protein
VGTEPPGLPGPKPITSPDNKPADQTGPAAYKPADVSEVLVVFEGAFGAKGDTRKVLYKCPHCQKAVVDVLAPNCLACTKAIKWPAKVPCKFCAASGKCTFCKGDGKCPECAKGGRMLMGVKPPCEVCNQTETCPACNGAGKCTFCEGGSFRPGVAPKPEKPKPEEQAPVPKPQSGDPAPIPKPEPGGEAQSPKPPPTDPPAEPKPQP